METVMDSNIQPTKSWFWSKNIQVLKWSSQSPNQYQIKKLGCENCFFIIALNPTNYVLFFLPLHNHSPLVVCLSHKIRIKYFDYFIQNKKRVKVTNSVEMQNRKKWNKTKTKYNVYYQNRLNKEVKSTHSSHAKNLWSFYVSFYYTHWNTPLLFQQPTPHPAHRFVSVISSSRPQIDLFIGFKPNVFGGFRYIGTLNSRTRMLLHLQKSLLVNIKIPNWGKCWQMGPIPFLIFIFPEDQQQWTYT